MNTPRLAAITLSSLVLSGCDVVQLIFPDPFIGRHDCANCAPVTFRTAADNSGTLASAWAQMQPLVEQMPADTRPLFLHARGVDMSGKLTLSEDTLWSIAFASDVELTYYWYQVDEQGNLNPAATTFATQAEYDEHLATEMGYLNVEPFAATSVVDILPLPAFTAVMDQIATSSDYNVSPYSVEVALYNNGSPIIVTNSYAESVTQDVATFITYDNNGIKVTIPNETEWNIVDFEATDAIVGDEPKEEWILEYYGKVKRLNYLEARKIYHLDPTDLTAVTLLPPES